FPGSGAEKAGIKDGDIILKINQEKITPQNLLAQIIIRYNPGDKITLTILRDGKDIIRKATLGEMK
ncbi:MAG: PDZ domain-containing protein, partial [Methanosarcinales archaeon]|nr:PDZ domain-containing protein [Methanosarcinales archaeon]